MTNNDVKHTKVKTYDPCVSYDCAVMEDGGETGAYVKHEDYETLEQQRDELAAAGIKYMLAIDSIYNSGEHGINLVCEHFGPLHPQSVLKVWNEKALASVEAAE